MRRTHRAARRNARLAAYRCAHQAYSRGPPGDGSHSRTDTETLGGRNIGRPPDLQLDFSARFTQSARSYGTALSSVPNSKPSSVLGSGLVDHILDRFFRLASADLRFSGCLLSGALGMQAIVADGRANALLRRTGRFVCVTLGLVSRGRHLKSPFSVLIPLDHLIETRVRHFGSPTIAGRVRV